MSLDIERTEDRLSRTLSSVAEQTPIRPNWDAVVADMQSRQGQAERSNLPRLLAAAAVVVLLLGGVLFAVQSGNDQSQTVAASSGLVLPGERVLSSDPLIVAAADGPEPEFDTSDLGARIEIEPMTELTPELLMLINSRQNEPEAKLFKATLLGEIADEPWLITVFDTPDTFNEGLGGSGHLRERSLGDSTGSSGVGDFVDPDGLEMIEPATSLQDGLRAAFGNVDPIVFDGLPAEVAVVALLVDDQPSWATPRAGVAIFPIDATGDVIKVRAFSVDGELLGETQLR